MRNRLVVLAAAWAVCSWSVVAQTPPGLPEDNGLTPKTDTIYINVPPDSLNNASTESLGVAIGQNGNIMVGWEDDGSDLTDLEAVWTMFNSSGVSITPDRVQTSLDPAQAGVSLTNHLLSYFRKDGSAVPGWASWGPKIKANLFGDGFGMGATSFGLGVEVPEFAAIQTQADNTEGDFPSVQLLAGDGQPVGIVAGVDDAFADRTGGIRVADWEYLSNGNIVIVGESRQAQDLIDVYGGTVAGNHAIYRIVNATGNQIKAVSLVSATPDPAQIWHGVGVTSNGFAVRFDSTGAKVRMFDNSGNPTTTNIDLATLTGLAIAGAGGRGDGTGFHGNGKDAYVAATAGTDDLGAKAVWVTVLNADGTLRYSTNATAGLTLVSPDRVDAAIDVNGRVLAVFDDTDASGTGAYAFLVGGRLLDATGKPSGQPFYVSEAEPPSNSLLQARHPRVAWRGDLAAIVWESKNNPNTPDPVVAMRLFSTFKPGSVESVGLTRIVADTPIIVPAGDSLGNWEPYASVLGTGVFLIEGNTFAENTTDQQRYVVALQPAAGGAMKLGEAFFADNGQPFKGQINLSRVNGNPGRVAGDKRPGAVNFVTGGECSLYGFPASFNTDGRFDPNSPFYSTLAAQSTGGRDGCVQCFSLAPATLAQTMLCKAFDSAFGRCCTNSTPPNLSDQISRFGGELAGLDNGDFVSVVEDRSQFSNASGNAAVATIFRPDGSIVKEAFKVGDGDFWSNVAACRGGFAVRVAGNIYFFDNAGSLQGQVDQNTSGASFDRGRGDGTRIFAHINSPYVYLVGKVTDATTVKIAVWDSRNRQFVALADASEAAFPGGTDRANGAVDALNRMSVAWVLQPPGYANQQVAARVLALNETTKTIAPLTSSFFPFINAATNDTIRTLQMTVAVTTRQICVAAKGEINLQNQPQLGANSPHEINFFTVFTQPDPQNDPTTAVGAANRPALAVSQSSGNILISWPAAFTGFAVQSADSLVAPNWADLNPQPPITQSGASNVATIPIGTGNKFYRLQK